MGQKEKHRQNNQPLEIIIKSDDVSSLCEKNGIATSYAYNIDAPELPLCKAYGYCKNKIKYDGKDCCLYMHEVYRRELE